MLNRNPLCLAATAAIALTASSPSLAQQATPAAWTVVPLAAQGNHEVLERLVERYKGDPSTYEDSVKWIRKNKPSILKAFNARTKGSGQSRAVEPKAGTSSGLVLAGGAGVLGVIAAAMGSKKEKKNTPADHFPEGVIGDAESFRSSEYFRNSGLAQINAAEKYAQGAWGQGVKISMMDTGIDVDNPEFAGRIDLENSFSLYDDPSDLMGSEGATHGTAMASIMVAAKDKKGIHGVAYGAELVVIRGIGSSSKDTSLSWHRWSEAIDASVSAGASVMNNSWSYQRVNDDNKLVAHTIDYANTLDELTKVVKQPAIDSIRRAVDNDLLFVVAAGNSGLPEVGTAAGIPLVIPEFGGHFIAAVMVDHQNKISGMSNRCGAAASFCLAAPGDTVNAVSGRGEVTKMAGTSLSSAYISGAAAVLKGQNPELTSPEISQIMFDTATDLGAPGVDAIYGHGLLNLGKASAPVGALMVYEGSSVDGGSMPLSGAGVSASSAMAPALVSALSGRDLMVGDNYNRGFVLDAAAIVGKSKSRLPVATMRSSTSIGNGLSLISSSHGYGIEYGGSNFSYSMVMGDVGNIGTGEALSPLSFMESEFGASYKAGVGSGLSFTAELSGASQRDPHVAGAVGLMLDMDAVLVHAKIGVLEESGTVLGSRFMGAAGNGGSSNTMFLEIENSFSLSDDLRLSVAGTRSQTDFSQSGLITGGSNLEGTAGKLAISKDNFIGSTGTFTASLSSPLQVTSGNVSIDMPSSRAASVDGMVSSSVGREVSNVEFEASNRPYDVSFSFSNDMEKNGLNYMVKAGYRSAGKDSEPFIGLMISKSF